MENISLTDIAATNESTAVAAGKIVLAAELPARIGDCALTEAAWSEMLQYLSRRGVTVAYDHDDGYPVASVAVRS